MQQIDVTSETIAATPFPVDRSNLITNPGHFTSNLDTLDLPLPMHQVQAG
jgi:hypothetical protein